MYKLTTVELRGWTRPPVKKSRRQRGWIPFWQLWHEPCSVQLLRPLGSVSSLCPGHAGLPLRPESTGGWNDGTPGPCAGPPTLQVKSVSTFYLKLAFCSAHTAVYTLVTKTGMRKHLENIILLVPLPHWLWWKIKHCLAKSSNLDKPHILSSANECLSLT